MSSMIYDSQDNLIDFVTIFKQNDIKEAFRILQSLGGGDQIVKKLLFRKDAQMDIQQIGDQKAIHNKYGPNFQGFQELSLLNQLKSILNYQQLSLILFGICLGTFYYQYNNMLVGQICIFESYILFSIIIPLINQSQNKKKQVQEMNRENYYTTKVLDQGEEKIKYYKELVEGDIIILEPTDQLINVDGLLLLGNITVDESLITGDSEIKLKSPYESKNINIQNNPFIYSGSRVLEGKGQMIVLTTGINTQYFKNKINRYLQQEVSKEQTYIDKIKKFLIVIGLISMVLTFGIQIKFDLNNIVNARVFKIFLIVIITLSMNLTVFPISLQLILNIIKPRIIQQLNHLNITVNADNCLDKIENINYLISEYTGVFTENCLKVIRVHIGGIKITKVKELQLVSDNLSNHFLKCCFYTTTCIQKQDKYIGDQFECALLKFISKLHNNIQAQRIQDNIIKQYNQFKTDNYNITIVKIVNQYILYVTGKLKTILPHCQQSDIIEIFQNQNNLLVMAYKILNNIDETNNLPENLLNDLNLISIVELQDPAISNIDDTLRGIKNINLSLLIVTQQNKQQMIQFASQYLQTTQTNSILTGEELRNITGGIVRNENKLTIRFFDDFLKIIHNLRIVAEANGYDRLILNIGIQKMGLHVAAIANSFDLANLRFANVGILLNERIQEQGQEADIQINSNKINDIFSVIQWSSAIRNNTRRIIQFQLPSTITTTVGFLLIYKIILNQQIIFFNQIIWINVIINGLITFSLNSEPPCGFQGKQFILTAEMAKHIVFSLIFQLAAILFLSFLSDQHLFLVDDFYLKDIQRITIIFQTLVLFQIFGSISVKFNFQRKLNNPQFFIFVILALLSQYTMICIYPEYFNFCFLTLTQHLLCLMLAISYLIVVSVLCFIVPTRWFNKILKLFQTNVNQHIPQINKSHSIEMSQSLKERLLQ